MATAKLTFDEGSTSNVATYTITEDAVTKHINRSVLSNSGGTELATAANPLFITAANGTVNSGTINAGTINAGTINVGTIGGKAASGAASVANPVQIAGTDSGGTIYSPLINTAGAGTISGVGTIPGVGVVTSLTGGTVSINAGTIGAGTINNGTLTLVTTVSNLTAGSLAVTAGTVGGKAASGAPSVANPMQIAGTDSGGTIYSPLISIAGAGTVSGVGTVPGIGVVTTLTNLSNGTIQNSGTVTGVGVVTMLSAGTLSNGTINSGTINSGTINAGTINTGTINSGTINAGTINSGTINAGTIRNDARPARNILSFGTTIAFAGSAFATLVGSAVVGAGTSLWINDVSIVNNGAAVTSGIVFGSNINGSAVVAKGNFAANGGIQKSFPLSVNCGMTNTDLNAWSAGVGTIDFCVSYFISA